MRMVGYLSLRVTWAQRWSVARAAQVAARDLGVDIRVVQSVPVGRWGTRMVRLRLAGPILAVQAILDGTDEARDARLAARS